MSRSIYKLILVLCLSCTAAFGQPSPSSVTVTVMPGATIKRLTCVVIQDGFAVPADPTNAAQARQVMGVALNSSFPGGGPVTVQVAGEVPAVGLTANTKYFVQLDGSLGTTEMPGGAVWGQYIGYARSATQLELQPNQFATGSLSNTLASGHVFVGNAANVASDTAVSGDASMSNAGALTVTKTNGVPFAASATTDTTDASNISTGTLPAGRMPALTGDVTTTAGAVATTLATVNSNVGSFTNANVTVNAKGLVTAAANGTSGTVTSVTFTGDGIVDSATPSSAVTTSGTVTATALNQTKNTVLAGPTTGSAAAPSFRALVGADLPNPSASTLGGVESLAAVSHQFLTSISTSGVPAQAQPAAADVSGLAASATTDTTVATNITSGTLPFAQNTAAVKAASFGGDGSAGALSLSATESNIIQYNGTTVSVADGATESMLGPSVINATSTITIGGGASGILKEAGNGGRGGTSQSAASAGAWGGGPAIIINTSTALVARSSGGAGATYTNSGGGGGGGGGWVAGGAGGAGGGGGAAGAAGFQRSALHGSFAKDYVGAGGGSGAGGQGTASVAGGNGGDGIILCAVGNITVASGAVFSCDGVQPSTPGADATGHGVGGSGGGGGGFARAYSLGQVIISGTMRANGGAGGTGGAAKTGSAGNGGGGGGGGGAGIVLRMSTTAPGGAGTVTSNGGVLGSGGAKDGVGTIGVNGNAGSNSTPLAITGTPNFPLIVMHQKWVPGVMEVIAHARCKFNEDGKQEYRMNATENSSMMAACETSQRGQSYLCFMQMNNHLLTSTEWVPNNAVAILNDPSKVQAKLDDFTCETLTKPEHGLYCGGLDESISADRT